MDQQSPCLIKPKECLCRKEPSIVSKAGTGRSSVDKALTCDRKSWAGLCPGPPVLTCKTRDAFHVFQSLRFFLGFTSCRLMWRAECFPGAQRYWHVSLSYLNLVKMGKIFFKQDLLSWKTLSGSDSNYDECKAVVSPWGRPYRSWASKPAWVVIPTWSFSSLWPKDLVPYWKCIIWQLATYLRFWTELFTTVLKYKQVVYCLNNHPRHKIFIEVTAAAWILRIIYTASLQYNI